MSKKHSVNLGITCVGGRFVFDAIQALRSAPDLDITIIGIDANLESSGRLYVDVFETVPFASVDEKAYCDALVEICERNKIHAVFLWSEAETKAVARHTNLFVERGIKTTAENTKAALLVTHKKQLFDFLTKEGIDVGNYRGIHTNEEARIAISELGYPFNKVVVKPSSGTGSRGVLIADGDVLTYTPLLEDRLCGVGDIDALEGSLKDHNATFENCIAMPYLGNDVYDVDCLAVNGKAVNVVPRLRQYSNPLSPVNEGCRIAMDDDIIEYVASLAKVLDVHGVCDFDIARDDDGNPKVLDASLRMSGSVGASFVAGINLPAQLVRILLNLPIKAYDVANGAEIRPVNHFTKL
jgi:glutathione synthase/RimK-type ligase-like ATP-grasp enzyme